MGNSHTSAKNNDKNKLMMDPKITQAFNELSDGKDNVNFNQFQEKFGKYLSTPLWKYLQKDGGNTNEMSMNQFIEHSKSLMGMSTDIYVKLLMPFDSLLDACLETENIERTESDESFCNALKEDIFPNGKESLEAIIKWKNFVCPRLCQSVQEKVINVFFNNKKPIYKASSEVLTDVELFILSRTLPTTDESTANWKKLYSSTNDGISINRFEKNVFDYKGPTVSIFKLNNGEVYALALDQEWKHSVNKFGGSNSVLIQLRPIFKRFDVQTPALYCNFKNRSSAYGINYGQFLKIDGELNNVSEIEVWGCASPETLLEQQKQKLRQMNQAERNSKVPLPGAWDDNPDKNIMEMAGYQFSNERKHDRPD